jgi:hypothetical protein
MKHRSPAAVLILSLVTFGIYGIYWEVKTKMELARLGAEIPTAWLLIIPIANLYWIYKYAVGVEKVSGGKTSAVLVLILMLLLSVVGMAILQSEYNKMAAGPVGGGPAPVPPAAPMAGPTAPTDFTPPTNPTPPAAPQPPAPPAPPAGPGIV